MLCPPVPVELLLLANEAYTRHGKGSDVINTLLSDRRKFQFDDIYAAALRLGALWRAVSENRLEEWTAGEAGEAYGKVSAALWNAAASAKLRQIDVGSIDEDPV